MATFNKPAALYLNSQRDASLFPYQKAYAILKW